MATAKEEESMTGNAQVLYVIRFQAPLMVSSEEVPISKRRYFLSAAMCPCRLKLRLKWHSLFTCLIFDWKEIAILLSSSTKKYD